MELWNNRELKARARQALEPQAAAVRRTVLLYSGVVLGLSLGSSGLNFLLDSQIGTTGGIGGVGLRSVLQTIQTVLTNATSFCTTFWAAGFLYAMLMTLRGRTPRAGDMLEGFRRFGRILLNVFFTALVVILIGIVAMNVTALILSFTGWEQDFLAEAEPLLAGINGSMVVDEAALEASIEAALMPLLMRMLPMLAVFALLFLAGCIYMGYSFRMATYLMMERQIGGIRANFLSASLMRGYKWKMFKLDLSFWWYYLLSMALGGLAMLDVVLVLLGVELPFGEVVWYFGTMLLSYGLVLWLDLKFAPLVNCTYLAAFEAIAHPPQPETPETADFPAAF